MGCPFHRKNRESFWKKLKRLFRRFRKPKETGILSRENLAAILDASVDSIITSNEEGIILAFNKAAEQAFGYTKEEAIGQNVHILMPEPFYSQHDTYIQNYLRTGLKKIIGLGRDVIAQRKNGSTFPMHISVSEIFTGKEHLFTGNIRDISAQRRVEEVLKSHIRMEGEIAAKNEYISILSHELRTPLTVIYGALSLLNGHESLTKKNHELVNIAFRNAERLMQIINDVLDITKIQSGKLKLDITPISLSSLVQESIDFLKSFAEQLEIQLDYVKPSVDVIVLSDYNRLIQVMMNLLSNAIKFSIRKSKVIITITPSQDSVRVAVQDFGKGIPASFQDKIFTPFAQAPVNEARTVGGTGLGLYICKMIIDQLHGNIGFTTQENEGTTFFFVLPIHKGKT